MLEDPQRPDHAAGQDEPAGEALTPAMERFTTCRWRVLADEDTSAHCSHRDVHPFAGTSGFNAEAWCPDCDFYKVRRNPKKRPVDRDTY